MDVLIIDGDISLKSGGVPEMTEGFTEIVQKIKLACAIPKASFIYDRNMGAFDADINTLSDETVEMLINENLIGTGCTIKLNSRGRVSGLLRLHVTIFNGYRNYTTEVIING
ncbi:MAG: hypothetical protein VZR54_08670 [Ruminococcus sp.]|jgi:hypothetical protein|nr:hypothetical protein [Ruminococcus sp.]